MQKLFLSSLFGLFFSISILGCNQGTTTVSGPIARVGEPINAETVGSVSGTVTLAGPAPKRPTIDMSQDPACSFNAKAPVLAEAVTAIDGKLVNAFVYVKEGAEKFAVPPPSEAAILDQKGCRYVPHVMGLMTGQKLRILNSDPAMHNVHPTAKNNESWNISQMPGAPPMERMFTQEELMLPITCNQHPWMKMYVNVMEHPFFSVTDSQGRFEIKDLPPGEYTLAVVHEKLGPGEEMKIKIAPKEAKRDVQFAYTQAE